MKKFLGIEIGGTKLQLVSGNDRQIDHRICYTVDRVAGAEGIRKYIEEALKHWNGHRMDGIGVGFGGPVDRHKNTIWTSYHIEGWSGFSLADWLTQLTGAPVIIENDANVAALGEALYGAGKDYKIVFYVTLGSGVGGGLVIDQKLYHGVSPGEAEFGHIRLDKSGRIVQSSCSGWAVNEKIRNAAAAHPASELALLVKRFPSAEAKILLEAIQLQDPFALKIFDETIDDLAFALSHAVQLFHPDAIVLGGGLSLIGEPLRLALSNKIVNYLMDAFQPGQPILLSLLKADAVPVGCLALAGQQLNQ